MKIRTGTLQQLKQDGKKFASLTSYDMHTATIFDEAGIEVLLVGDSASDNVLGNVGTSPITLDEMIPFGKAVARAAKRALVIVDLPFGTYELGPDQALASSIRVMKETGAAGVKLEGAKLPQIANLVENGIPVMGHVGFTPQTVHALSGFKVQGRNDEDAKRIMAECLAIEQAGAFAIVLEMVPAYLASEISLALKIPTIGIGAGNECDGQILVWQDFAGLSGKTPSFAKNYLRLRDQLSSAAAEYRAEVIAGEFPKPEQSF
ncbi:MAG: 3-methyl-2-oxobutanoate hydroxymethyltransferase [Aquiluna sp.]|nr:3-methyl-2-oxobutanoate hydroxymethyltransferase [Aquiluna sp.]